MGRLCREGGAGIAQGSTEVRSAAIHLFGERIPGAVAALYGPRGLRFLLNVATAFLVLSLPLAASASSKTAAAPTALADVASVSSISSASSSASGLASIATAPADEPGARVQSSARGMIAGSRSVLTVAAEDVRPVVNYVVNEGDNLGAIAEQFQVKLDDLAYANEIDDEATRLSIGQTLIIPPGRGALYYVKEGDSVAAIAEKFKVKPGVIMTYNRLYFEPEHFAPEQLIFVPGAEVPAMKRTTITRTYTPSGQLPARTGRLAWPVNGVITQYFWWGHSGVDVAAPYGTGIMASDDGVVTATGWVAVGGLRVCVQHSGGLQTCYYHASSIYVSPGQTVTRGQVIAAIGMTGVTTGPHVHWEARLNGVAVNALGY
ncbi:MAG: M23 family metallopeptidase [Chloroflexota bacterium]